MAILPAPKVERHGHVLVVRDDLIPGGSKRRVIDRLLVGGDEFVYASPAYGYAQIALAHACRAAGKRATIFTAKRSDMHQRTREAAQAGARVVMVPYGYLSNVKAKATAYCNATGAILIPFGMDLPIFGEAFAQIAAAIDTPPPAEVWTVAGSGTLSRALQAAWPAAQFHAVRVGADPRAGRAALHVAPERFEDDARDPPPFKAWQFIRKLAAPGALFWNVAA
jgi:hypothetical protein